MTLDEAIQHGEAIATEYEYEIKEFLAVGDEENAGKCIECRDNHVQLINWLKELKDLRILIGGEDNYLIEPSEQADVQPIRRGHWIEKVSYSGWGVSIYTCSECENAETIPSKFCPNCGAELRGVENG